MRYDGEHKVTIVCGAGSDEPGSGGGLPGSRLESVGCGLPLSPVTPDFEGFEEGERVQRGGAAGRPFLVPQAMVHTPPPQLAVSQTPPCTASH